MLSLSLFLFSLRISFFRAIVTSARTAQGAAGAARCALAMTKRSCVPDIHVAYERKISREGRTRSTTQFRLLGLIYGIIYDAIGVVICSRDHASARLFYDAESCISDRITRTLEARCRQAQL